MSFLTVNTHRSSPAEAMNVKIALEKLAKNLSTDNLVFLATLSEKPNINSKLESKKKLIQMSL